FALTKYAASNGVVVSMGHSNATFNQAVMAIANGAKSITHTYNAMSPFSHRENGLVGTALRLHDVYSEVICDCNHSTPEALNVFFHSKDSTKAIMISDGLMCKGFPTGTKFMFGGHEIEIYPDGSAHLVKEKNLAGSTLKINEGLKNLVEKAGVPFAEALNSCTLNPATMLKMEDKVGRIAAGCDASIVVLEDNYDVKSVYVQGENQF
ncbi:MAG: amidohydrolase family protein, partial [Erysipelotrichaceae bacterium]|nr:amidohydrolase family protein [Erysipelotrichaceae bacterium]